MLVNRSSKKLEKPLDLSPQKQEPPLSAGPHELFQSRIFYLILFRQGKYVYIPIGTPKGY